MKFGFIATSGTAEQVIHLAEEVEANGWDGFFHWDGIGGGSYEADVFDPWAILAAVAVKTERVTLGAIIFPLSRRRPWKVAREALTIDHLSHGRLVIPVGLGAVDDGGFSKVHPEATDRRERAERLDETLEILEKAWSGESFTYQGKHYQLDDIRFIPRSVQQPRIPIWCVGSWPRPKSMARAARWDGILPSLYDNPFGGLKADDVSAVRNWIVGQRGSKDNFDIVLEGVSPANDPEWIENTLRPVANAGATWWIESRWEAPNDYETLLDRVRQGPPRLQVLSANVPE
jgi:alkanesulfonate monooxygenase SsuD/methylene tetrahydromethanopterin reductase-like flavin-dependent oxidoreductase (luciferase family)